MLCRANLEARSWDLPTQVASFAASQGARVACVNTALAAGRRNFGRIVQIETLKRVQVFLTRAAAVKIPASSANQWILPSFAFAVGLYCGKFSSAARLVLWFTSSKTVFLDSPNRNPGHEIQCRI